jgi:hypothetical protein
MELSKILNNMIPTNLHNGAVNLLDKANNLRNPAITCKISKISCNIFTAMTGAAASIQEGLSTVVKIPVVMLAGTPLAVARLFKKDFLSSANDYVPTISSTSGTAKRTACQALGVIASVGAILGEMVGVGRATSWNLKAQQNLGNAVLKKQQKEEIDFSGLEKETAKSSPVSLPIQHEDVQTQNVGQAPTPEELQDRQIATLSYKPYLYWDRYAIREDSYNTSTHVYQALPLLTDKEDVPSNMDEVENVPVGEVENVPPYQEDVLFDTHEVGEDYFSIYETTKEVDNTDSEVRTSEQEARNMMSQQF